MRLSLYARDIGPSKSLGQITNEAVQRGHRVAYVGNDDLGNRNLLDPTPDVLVTGLSSATCADELRLGQKASERNIPWVVLADSHRTWARKASAGQIGNAHVLVASPGEIDAARAFGYKSASYVGGPPLWQSFRSLSKEPLMRQNPKEKIILVGGSKDAEITDDMCRAVVRACANLFGENWALIFKPHPNENQATQDPHRRTSMLGRITRIDIDDRTSDLVGRVDCSIFPPGATDTITAAHLRQPTIYFESEAALAQLERLTGERTWFPAEAGAAIKATTETMRAAIKKAISKRGAARLRARQEKVYPLEKLPQRVEALIVTFLEKLVTASAH